MAYHINLYNSLSLHHSVTRDQPPNEINFTGFIIDTKISHWFGSTRATLQVFDRNPGTFTNTCKEKNPYLVLWSSMHWEPATQEPDTFSRKNMLTAQKRTRASLHVDDERYSVELFFWHKHSKCDQFCAENDPLVNKSANWSPFLTTRSLVGGPNLFARAANLWTDTPAARHIFTCTVIAQYRRHVCLAQVVKFELRSQNTHYIHASWLIFCCTRHWELPHNLFLPLCINPLRRSTADGTSAEYQPLTGYEPKRIELNRTLFNLSNPVIDDQDDIEEIGVKPMSYSQSLIHWAYDSAESITTPPDSDPEDEQLRMVLCIPKYRGNLVQKMTEARSKCTTSTSLSLRTRKLNVNVVSRS